MTKIKVVDKTVLTQLCCTCFHWLGKDTEPGVCAKFGGNKEPLNGCGGWQLWGKG